VTYIVRDVTDTQNLSEFEIELDEPPREGESLPVGTMVYEVLRVSEEAVIEVRRQVGPGQMEP
jgi:hypothetical protein